jgi:hypothetical protein
VAGITAISAGAGEAAGELRDLKTIVAPRLMRTSPIGDLER